jgi:phosphatidylserine/phosphatidylglycerophosphate/cardiolipin synthase-like enzyme
MSVDFAKRTAERSLHLISSLSANSLAAARLYAWEEKDDEFSGGSVHVKVAVADGRVCFITSANLTGHAMEKKMWRLEC